MNDPQGQPQYESILLRVLWMVIYLLVWQVAQFILAVRGLADPAHAGR